MFEVIIVGGGPAGLNAALVLGRCLRRVLLYDDGRPRNRASRAVHGFLTRDGIDPGELRRIARAQLLPYETVCLRDASVASVRRIQGGFEVRTSAGDRERARRLLLATGLTDALPDVRGASELYGRCIFHCPYCAFEAEGPGMRLCFEGGLELVRRALFFNTTSRQVSSFASELGCSLDEKACVRVELDGTTDRDDVYAAGDLTSGARQVVIAAAQGAAAAIAINISLIEEDR